MKAADSMGGPGRYGHARRTGLASMLGWAVVRVDGGDGPARAGRRNGMSHAHGNERLDLASVPNASSACAENKH
jgi:hypothetical protein